MEELNVIAKVIKPTECWAGMVHITYKEWQGDDLSRTNLTYIWYDWNVQRYRKHLPAVEQLGIGSARRCKIFSELDTNSGF